MGEKQNEPFQLSFNASLKVDFQGSRVTSDGGLILVRELDERLGFGELLAHSGNDPQPYAFTGEPYDLNVGFAYHRQRWLDPSAALAS